MEFHSIFVKGKEKMSSTLFVGKKLIILDEIDSTNLYLQTLLATEAVPEGTAVTARYQTAGRGQRGNYWESQSGKNLLLSVLLCPRSFHVSMQFMLSQAISLAVRDLVAHYLPAAEVKVKWPNDILINGRKTAGILIENTLQEEYIKHSIVGIGLNVNEDRHPYPKSTSISLESGDAYDLEILRERLFGYMEARYLQLLSHDRSRISYDYLNNLFGLGNEMEFFDRLNNTEITGCIKGIAPSGKLIVESGGEQKQYDLKEISFL